MNMIVAILSLLIETQAPQPFTEENTEGEDNPPHQTQAIDINESKNDSSNPVNDTDFLLAKQHYTNIIENLKSMKNDVVVLSKLNSQINAIRSAISASRKKANNDIDNLYQQLEDQLDKRDKKFAILLQLSNIHNIKMRKNIEEETSSQRLISIVSELIAKAEFYSPQNCIDNQGNYKTSTKCRKILEQCRKEGYGSEQRTLYLASLEQDFP